MVSSLIEDAKREIEAAVSQGYSPARVDLPRTPGCLACAGTPAPVLIFAAKKIDRTMSFRYCFAKVCGPCFAIGEAEDAMGLVIAEE